MQQIVISPLRVPKSKSKDFIINMNVMRNTHYRTLATAKRNYTEIMKEQMVALTPVLEAKLLFIIYPKTRRKFDLDNIGGPTAKFFQDAMTTHGVIPDDNYEYITEVTFRYGELDKENPRVEVLITSPDEYDNDTELLKTKTGATQ